METIIALVGRPNVGKSTLFNRLAGKKLAIVDDQPGVTRDYKTAPFSIEGFAGLIMDTAGLSDVKTGIEQAMTQQSLRALQQASLLIFMIDGASGVTPTDMEFARQLRKTQKPIVLIANKSDRKDAAAVINETHKLGFGAPIMVSASHGLGIDELLSRILPYLKDEVVPEDEEAEKSLRLAIVGRPNAGKSTFLNALLNEERSLTGDLAGTTRDPVSVEWEYEDKKIRLVDTAGLRRRSKVIEKVEQMATDETRRIIRLAELVIMLVDATQPFDQQDLTIIQNIYEEGRAMVLVVNKWDLIENKKAADSYINDALQRSLPFVRGIPIIQMSALKGGKKLHDVMKAVFAQHKVWNKRVSTGQLNRWLADMIARNPPPLSKGRPNRIRYMTQIKARPPSFAIWLSQPNDLPDSYERFLINSMRGDFKMPGVPIRITRKKGENPYADKAK